MKKFTPPIGITLAIIIFERRSGDEPILLTVPSSQSGYTTIPWSDHRVERQRSYGKHRQRSNKLLPL